MTETQRYSGLKTIEYISLSCNHYDIEGGPGQQSSHSISPSHPGACLCRALATKPGSIAKKVNKNIEKAD